MRILVTGDLGFVGTETVRQLNFVGDEVYGYDLMEGYDIRDKQLIKEAVADVRPDAILHLAAIARFADADADPKLAFETNVEGTCNVVRICQKFHVPLVYASTGSAIMPLDRYMPPYAENIPARGNSVYGCSKAVGEYIVREHTPHIILRYAHIYGKEKRGHGLVGDFLKRINRGIAPVIFGGQQSNDFCYVKDIGLANGLALHSTWDKWNQTYHIGTGEELSAIEAGQMVCDVFGYEGDIEQGEARTVDPSRFVFDISKARLMLDYAPRYTFRDGLLDMQAEMRPVKYV